MAEILSICLDLSKGSSDYDHFLSLKKNFDLLDIYEVRNSISHANRKFPENFWYKCAVIVTSDFIVGLGFDSVRIAFENAIAGKIEEPPEDWLNHSKWSLPCNLPSTFEHALTGLVARQKELNSLAKELKNQKNNLLAVVARGGVGKTSLALQALSDFAIASESQKYFDGLIWVSLKQEKLTAQGIVSLNAPASMKQLRDEIEYELSSVFTFDLDDASMKEEINGKKILLCIDNLETILRDSPSDFEEFYENLPLNWKVLITSRIPVESAKNIRIDVLEKNGAISLVKAYFAAKAIDIPPIEVIDRICKICFNNPLAIRLTIDKYSLGQELENSLASTSEEVLDFSFSTLLDCLDENKNNILEALFSLGKANRQELLECLQIDLDTATDNLNYLSKTSLVLKEEVDSGQLFELPDSIRDLLRAHPRNMIFRNQVNSWISKNKQNIDSALEYQASVNLPKIDLYYIPDGVSNFYIQNAKKIQQASKNNNRQALVAVERGLQPIVKEANPSAFACRLYAAACNALGDTKSAVDFFRKSIELDPVDPAPYYQLSQIYRTSNGEADKLYQLSLHLVKNFWDDALNSNFRTANRVVSNYLHSANILKKFPEVFEYTNNWRKEIQEYPSKAIGRAAALRRNLDQEYHDQSGNINPKRIGEMLSKASDIFILLLEKIGIQKFLIAELNKLLDEIVFYMKRLDLSEISTSDKDKLNVFINLIKSKKKDILKYNGFDAAFEFLDDFESSIGSGDFDFSNGIHGVVKDGSLGKPYFFVKSISSSEDYYARINKCKLHNLKNRIITAGMNVVIIKFENLIHNDKESKNIEEIYFL